MANYLVLDDNTLKLFKPIMSNYLYELLTVREDFFAIGAIEDDAACGYMVVSQNELGYIIQDIFVHPIHRREGIGTGLIKTLVLIAGEYVEDIDCHFMLPSNRDFKLLLESTGVFVIDEDDDNETRVYRGSVDALYDSEFLKPVANRNFEEENCVDFYDGLSSTARKKFIMDCEEQEYLPVYNIPVNRAKGCDYCYAGVTPDHQEVNAFLMVNVANDTAYLDSAWCKKGHEKQLMVILAGAAKKLHDNDKINILETCVVEEEVEKLLNRLAPGLEIVAKGISAYWNYQEM